MAEPTAATDAEQAWSLDHAARVRRLRADARRPLAVNLAEGLRLSQFLASFAGSARRA